MKYDFKELVQYIVWLASQQDILLTKVRIVKFLYLIDLYHARLNNGKTLTDWPWAFVDFGPYCSQSMKTIEDAVSYGFINKKTYGSHYEDRDEYDLFIANNDDEPKIAEDLHIYIVSELTKAVKIMGDDTGRLLDFAYFDTEPMMNAQPKQRLDFSTVNKPQIIERYEMKKISPESLIKGRSIIEKMKKKRLEAVRNQKEREKQRIDSGLYDDHYEQAMKYMEGDDLETGLNDVARIDT